MKKFLKWTGILLLVIAGVFFCLYMIFLRPFMQKMKVTETIPMDGNFTVITGGGGNSGIVTSDSLLLLIDTKMDEAAEKLSETVRTLQGKRKLLVINTHWHPDHVGGNHFYNKSDIAAGGSYSEKAWIKEADKESLPGRWFKGTSRLALGDDTATIIELGRNVHTPSDILVYLHKRKVLFSGDVILNQQAPVLMGDADGYGYIETMEALQKQYDIRVVVPGHGPIGGAETVDQFLEFFKDMKTAAADPELQDELIAKYEYWNQVPFLMSPKATMKHFRSKMKK